MSQENENLPAVAEDNKDNSVIETGKAIISSGIDKFDRIKVPSSIDWFFSLGFKVGIFILLKSFLVITSQSGNMTLYGNCMVISQMLLAVLLMGCGVLLQNQSLYNQPKKMKSIALIYLFGACIAFLPICYGKVNQLNYFKAESVLNPIRNFLNTSITGIKNISLKILFADASLWTFFALILFIFTELYLIVSFGELEIRNEYSDGSPEAKKARIAIQLRKYGALLVAVAAIAAILYFSPMFAHLGQIKTEYSTADFKNANYEDVFTTLNKEGFVNINLYAKQESVILPKTLGKVKDVTVDGEALKKDEWLSKKQEIDIYVVSKKLFKDIKLLLGETCEIKTDADNIDKISVDDAAIASISNGVVEALSLGETTVSVSVEGMIYTFTVKVVDESELSKVADTVGNTIKDAGENTKDLISDVGNAIKDGFSSGTAVVKDVVSEGTTAVKDGVSSIFNKIIKKDKADE